MKSWRTTTLGICAIVTALANIAVSVANGAPVDYAAAAAAIIPGMGLIFSRDNKVTSEEAGAK